MYTSNREARPPLVRETLVPELITWRATVNPKSIAVVERGRRITYEDLDRRSNRLAHHIRSLGVSAEELVGLCMERSIDYVTAALAILKAGAAYVPFDPAQPAERLRFMLNDAGVKLQLSHRRVQNQVTGGRWRTLNLDNATREIDSESESPVEHVIEPNHLAYVVYTSGSTGRPKGVEIEHHSLLNLARWHQRAFSITPADRTSQFAGLGFDAAVWEIWPNLASGASVYLVDEAARTEPEHFRDWIVKNRITVCFAPTPIAQHLIQLEWPEASLLRVLLTGGDALRRRPLPSLPFQLVNNYGPAECAVVATSGTVAANNSKQAPSIGSPIDNTVIYVLDENRQPVSKEQPGEIYIAGAGVARGYHNLPDLTRRCFVSPFTNEPNDRCYKTGDVARILPNGQLQFLGRADDQIEIRGHRIEPGEIAGVLVRLPEVLASAAVVHEDHMGDKHLIAYIVLSPDAGVNEAGIRAFLESQLPAYMVPRFLVFIDELPLTTNGKIDHSLLPAPIKEAALDPVRPDVMHQVSAMIANLVGVNNVDKDENFFLLGGHSLLGAQLIARVRESFGVDVTLRTLFESPTVAGLSARVKESLETIP